MQFAQLVVHHLVDFRVVLVEEEASLVGVASAEAAEAVAVSKKLYKLLPKSINLWYIIGKGEDKG